MKICQGLALSLTFEELDIFDCVFDRIYESLRNRECITLYNAVFTISTT